MNAIRIKIHLSVHKIVEKNLKIVMRASNIMKIVKTVLSAVFCVPALLKEIKSMISSDDKTIVFSIPYIKDLIPVGIIFKALGFINENDISGYIGLNSPEANKFIQTIIRDSFFIETQEDALNHLGQFSMHIIPKEKRRVYAWQVVESELFPHMGISATVKEKAIILGNIIRKLIKTRLELRSPDDRDNYANKRIESCGILCTELFKTLFKRYIHSIKLQLPLTLSCV